MEEGAHSMRRAQESVPSVYGLQLAGKGRRLQKEEPVALERLVAVDVNQRSIDGYTSLHVATAAGNAEMVALLLESRADVSLSTVYRSELPIHFAAQGGYDIVLRLLAEPTKARGMGRRRFSRGIRQWQHSTTAQCISCSGTVLTSTPGMNCWEVARPCMLRHAWHGSKAWKPSWTGMPTQTPQTVCSKHLCMAQHGGPILARFRFCSGIELTSAHQALTTREQ